MSEHNKDTKANALLFLHGQTPMHPGSGTAMGVVDLPIQRERHTGWPVVPGSALKGILRDACREEAKVRHGGCRRKANDTDPKLTAVFGPGLVDDSNSFAGALTLTDARILAFPVRSLKGVFAWVTCPAVIERLARDTALAEAKVPDLLAVVGKNEALCKEQSPLLLDDSSLVLEEFEFKRTGEADRLAKWISASAAKDQATQSRIETHLAVLHDDDFTYFVRHATEVAARIGLDYERKTVKSGALFYEEFLPAETLLYSVVIANRSRSKGNGMVPMEVLQYLKTNLPGVLQIGADETIGKGLCVPNIVLSGGNNHE